MGHDGANFGHPVRQLELILSKMIPLSILCLLAFGISVGLGIYWFGVPFHGNLFLYFWLACFSSYHVWDLDWSFRPVPRHSLRRKRRA